MEIIFTAGRATRGSAGTDRLLPLMAAIAAVKNAGRTDYFVVTTFNIDRFAVNQGIRHSLVGLLNDSAEGCPGNAHVTTGFLMGHSQQIRQSNGLALINRQPNLLQIEHGNAPGLKITDLRIKCDPAVLLRSNHIISFMRIFSKLNITPPDVKLFSKYFTRISGKLVNWILWARQRSCRRESEMIDSVIDQICLCFQVSGIQ
jgi:hypothetical protein